MKSIILSIALFAIVLGVKAQNTCSKLNEVYTSEEISKLENADYLCFLASEGFLVNDMGDKDLSQYPDISTLQPINDKFPVLSAETFDKNTFNLLKYQFELKESQHTIYRIGDTGLTLFLHSKVRADILFERYQINQASQK